MEQSLSKIRGIGPARVMALNRAGIYTPRDLVMNLPKDYRDTTQITPVGLIRAGETVAVRARVCGDARQQRAGKLLITKVFVTDGEDVLLVVWYNQPWLKNQLSLDRELLLYGKAEWKRNALQLTSPVIEQKLGLIPVYRTVAGISEKVMRATVETVLEACDAAWPEELPQAIRRRFGLCERNFALRNAHFPGSHEALTEARRRLAFEELLLFQVAVMLQRSTGRKGVRFTFRDEFAEDFWNRMPFVPTNAQRRVLKEIEDDLKSEYAMARLVQGDVGCGKTAIAFAAIAMAHASGYQSAMMAPTEVLARQHFDSAKKILEPLGCRIGLLTGSLTAKQHRTAHEAIRQGDWDVVIGTHALITESVDYCRLGLVITDEQHRFGVRQRSMLGEKGDAPNVLVMSATPIPRTLSLILYGDLDISVVDELPLGRKPVATRIVPESRRVAMYGFLYDEIHKGHQAYVVCPLVEESEAVDAMPAEQVYEELQTIHLKDLRIELVHGRMKAADKEAALERFRTGEADVLVSTTVIEVGVNVPNATVMVIENAERFGLAQLHQLRGRVGRGSRESWCFLMGEATERLRFLASTGNGFRIAEKDLELRGPGEIFGTRQSGTMLIKPELVANDTLLLKITNELAKEVVKDGHSPDAATIIRLAKEQFAQRLASIAMN